MENAQNTVPAGSSLASAVERLDNALGALESRVKALQVKAGELPADSLDLVDAAEAARLKAEIEALKSREKLLEEASRGAFEALGIAAKDIRQILSEQAA
ncbi:hypothetical protein [Asticcacaulis sp. YBE204]|uniref:hypothetical protein n=1 Tax=Asticcacaulis sp. YBE204 TaxID=1282363 RepID=UPI0003C3C30D|nr:hypothetical protein [Asticcacaulis sp. YBE204]ESQ80214.1 hypothetical protein AEYBE204_06225 [Asticcacaulis sp. YBE204]